MKWNKVFEVTNNEMKTAYNDQINFLKKKLKEKDDRITLLKKMWIKKDGEISLLQEKIKGDEKEQKSKLEHAELLIKLASQLEEGSTRSEATRRSDTAK